MPRRKSKKSGPSDSWARARKLAELAEIDSVTSARSFIATDRSYVPLLEGRADKRNKKVREMIADFKKWEKCN